MSVTLRSGDRVLVTRLDYLGDVVLSLPLVDAILEQNPGVEVDYLARRPGADLLEGDGRFSRVFALARAGGLRDSLALVRALRARRYRVSIDLYSNPRSAWLTWLSGAHVRVGGDRRGRRRLYTHPVRVGGGIRAASAHHFEFGRAIGIVDGEPGRPMLAPTETERAAARRMLEDAGVRSGRPLVGMHPGGKWEVKRWPAESFAALARVVNERDGADVVVMTGPGESGHTDAVRESAGDAVRVLPPVGIREAAALLAEFDAMVVSDGGIMHVSVAVGTPTVGIFGSAEPAVWFPYVTLGPYAPAYVPLECRPCHRHTCPLGHTNCLNELSPEAVLLKLDSVRTRAADRDAGAGDA